MAHPSRSTEQIRQHYLIEKELASRLRTAGKEERRHLYGEVYDELFRRVPDHPQLALKHQVPTSAGARQTEVDYRLAFLRNYLNPELTYLEIGPGDCSLAIEVARLVRRVYAVDVSEEIAKDVVLPDNFELIISDGCNIPVPENSINIAYSDQLMEHLHPDDAMDQLQNIYRALAPGGVYICITPNRLSGPHDVSQYFDDVATGFHLKEYTLTELSRIFRSVGFREFQVLVGARGSHLRVPRILPQALEFLLESVGGRFGRKVARRLPLRLILGVKLIARK
jgi:SAM-dependent methyltransferase